MNNNDKFKNKKTSLDEDLSKYTLHAKNKIDEDDDNQQLGLNNDVYNHFDDFNDETDKELYSLSKTNRNKKSKIVIKNQTDESLDDSTVLANEATDNNSVKVNSGEEFLKLLNSKVARDKANLAANNTAEQQKLEQVQKTIEQTAKSYDKNTIRNKLKPTKNFDQQKQEFALNYDQQEDDIQSEESTITFKNSYKQSSSKPKSNPVSFKNSFEIKQLNPDELINLKSVIESTLYLAGETGASMHDLKRTTQLESNQIKLILNELQKDYDQQESGVLLVQFGEKFKIITQSKNKEALGRFVTSTQKSPLNQRLLETLTIIAYNQPTTRGFIESIRDKDPKPAIDSLIKLGLIVEAGHAKTPGHPILYVVTQKFYDMFGIRTVADLPKLNKEIKDFNPLEE